MDDATIERSLLLEDAIKTDLSNPLKSLLVEFVGQARGSAIGAMRDLIDVDAENRSEVRRLQAEVRRYRDLVEWMHERIATLEEERRFHVGEISEAERHELAKILQQPESNDA